MDEPFGALDAITRRRMHSALLDIWQRTRRTIVFVTHDILEALILADRIAVMSTGPVRASRISCRSISNARVIPAIHASAAISRGSRTTCMQPR